jgi:hypothetical protein
MFSRAHLHVVFTERQMLFSSLGQPLWALITTGKGSFPFYWGWPG